MSEEKYTWVEEGVLRIGKEEFEYMDDVPVKLLSKERVEEFIKLGFLKSKMQIVEEMKPSKKKKGGKE